MPYKNPEDDRAFRLRNRHKKLAYMKRYRLANLEREKKRYRQWALDNPEAVKAHAAAYTERHPDGNKQRRAKYYAKRKNDLGFLIEQRLRSRLHTALRAQRAPKFDTTFALVGCSSEFLRGYIEAQFGPGMQWNNIHVDHIVPVSHFDLTLEDEQRAAFHYSNLQPLFGVENIRKGASHGL